MEAISHVFCLTLDIDWAHDAVIADALALVERHGRKATWFVTHATPVLDEIRAAGGHELGLHPNLNPSFDGGTEPARDVVLRLRDIVADARAVRCHSLVRSSRLGLMFRELGLTHESNYLVPPNAGGGLGAWRDFTGLVEVPIRWEDDIRLMDSSLGEPAEHLHVLDPYVVDFHPIHVYLNSVTPADYEDARGDAQHPDRLLQRRRPAGSGGTRDKLIALLEAARVSRTPSCVVRAIRPAAES